MSLWTGFGLEWDKMTENKLTDKEIIKVLECCINSDGCHACPRTKYCDGFEHMQNALDLINRQQAEIERLTSKLDKRETELDRLTIYFDEEVEKKLETAKVEAVKEFITKHREIMLLFCDDDDQISLKVCEYDVNTKSILEEMVGEDI